jgi:transcriptional repressor NrdR
VIKKDETREDYSKEKLLEGLRRATKKRLGEEKLDRLFGEIENEIHSLGKTDISSKEIGNMVMRKLQAEDEVSYLRFASVFKSFGSGKRFLKELNRLEEN